MPHFEDGAPGREFQAPTIERRRRCENCRLWSNDAAVIADYEQRRNAEVRSNALKILDQEGVSGNRTIIAQRLDPKRVAAIQGRLNKLGQGFEMSDKLAAQGLLGICKGGHAPGTYVHAHYLCDNWQEKFKPEDGDDELPAEARERVFGKDK